MPRISEPDRLPLINAHIAHYMQAEIVNGAPILLEPLYGLPQLVAQRDQFDALGDQVLLFRETTLPNLRAQRDAIWGTGPNDAAGVWLRFTQYKTAVRTRLGPRHPLARTVPNLGDNVIERYLTIMHRFLNHWASVNAALATPLTLGTFTIATLQTAHDNMETLLENIEAQEDLARLVNEQQEQLFGDEPDDEREVTSIIAHLQLYHSFIEASFPNQPIADSLPIIFPTGPQTTPLPTFRFNWVAQGGGGVKVWFERTSQPPEATQFFLREGVSNLLLPLGPVPGSGIQVLFWSPTIVDELDVFETRDSAGITVARGVRDTSLPEPA